MSLLDTTKQEYPGVDVHAERDNVKMLHDVLDREKRLAVLANRDLVDTSVGAAKRHVDVRLPTECESLAGDYLVVQGRDEFAA